MNYLNNIECNLGDWRKLPENPFQGDLDYAVFSSSNGRLIDKSLYEAIFDMNKALGNKELIFKAFIDVNQKAPDLLVQTEKYWEIMDEFQESNLVYEGFYTTGDKLNWLGVYHPDDYFVLGATKGGLEQVCKYVYGHVDWKRELIAQYESGKLEIYQGDFEELQSNLL